MDLEDLSIFRTVAAEEGITRAAALLGRVPSNVTTRVQQLEADLGVQLFVRSGKKLIVSTAGAVLLDYASRMLALADHARDVVTGGRAGGSLRIGTMESTAASRLPAVLAAFVSGHPETQLEVSTAPSRQLLAQVSSGRLDCAFLALPGPSDDPASLSEAGLQGSLAWNEDLRLLVPARDGAARSVREIKTRVLAGFAQGCAYRELAERVLGLPSSVEWRVQEMGSYHAMVASVAAGACVAVLPRSVADMANVPQGVNAMELGTKVTWLVWRDGFDVPAFTKFRKTLNEVQHGKQ